MAADTVSSQTELIKVSQDSPITKHNSVVRGEVVDDSFPDAYQGGAVKTPQAALSDDDDDDLYSESPKAKSRRLSRNAGSNIAQTGVVGPSTFTARQERPTSEFVNGKQVGASQRKSQTRSQPRTALEDDQVDELAGHDDRLPAPVGSHVRSSQKLTHGTRALVAQTPNMSGATATVNGSALAALRARRQAQNPKTDGTFESRASVVREPPTTSNEDPKTNRKDLRTPAPDPPRPITNTAAMTRPSTGKLTARKRGFLKSTPRPSQVGEGVSVNGNDSDGTDELAKDPGPPTQHKDRSTKKGALKTRAGRGMPRTVKKKSNYDFEESPESQKSSEDNYSLKASKGTSARQGSSVEKTSKQTTTRSRAAQRAGPNATTSKRRNIKRDESPEKNSLRSRMKAESNAHGIELPASSAKSTTKAKSAAKVRKKQPDATPKTTRGSKQSAKPVDAVENPAILVDDNEERSGGDAYQDDLEDLQLANREKTLPDNAALQDEDITEGTVRAGKPETSTLRQRHLFVQEQSDADTGLTMVDQGQETPNVPRSSPPLTAPPMTELTRKKPTVIAFDKSGPQNQRTLSTKRSAATLARTIRSSVPPPPNFRRTNRARSDRFEQDAGRPQPTAGASTKSQKSNQLTTKANVAKDVTHALTDLVKRRSSTQAQIATVSLPATEDVHQNGHRNKPLIDLAVDDDDFMPIDDLGSPTMLAGSEIADAKPLSKHVIERTESQIRMPPPKSAKVKPPATAARGISNMTFESSRNARQSSTSEARVAPKRRHGEDTTAEHPSKRQRAHTLPPQGPPRPTRELRSTSFVLDEQRKPTFRQQKDRPLPEPEKRPSRKPSRQQSRGSQTVDMQGSPIPEGLTVDAKTTALQTYSQQAGLSSDDNSDGETASFKHTGNDIRQATTLQQFAPPVHQPDPMSSNKKKKPTGPEEESRGVERVVTADQRRPLVENEAGEPSTDPFTSAHEQRKQPLEGSNSSELLMQFKQQVYHEVITSIQHHPSTPRIPVEVFDSLRRGPVRHQVQESTVAAGRREARQQDPEKTLVEEEPQQRGYKRKRALSISTISSASSDSTPETPKSVRDLGAWRNALQPHQVNVFDGLVMVSHKLVRHLVDAETAAKDIKSDYRRRAMNIIEQMELRQRSTYENFENSIKSTKKQLRREYVDCAERLEEQVAAVRAAQRERKDISKRRDSVVETLQLFMAQVC